MSLAEAISFDDFAATRSFFNRSAETGVLRQALRVAWGIYPWVFGVAFIWIVISYHMGGAMILGMASARRVTFEENRELFRLVENTAIMCGLPVPEIYLIENASLNAFAVGCKPEKASIALTRGIVEKLDKDELQAVIAHELAHIGSRDTRLMMIVIAGIGCFTFLGESLLLAAFAERDHDRERSSIMPPFPFIILGFVCLTFGYVVAPILRSALSHRREFQADATAAKITRDPDALARALMKIVINSKVEKFGSCPFVGNICIVDPTRTGAFTSFESKLFSTHPSIDERLTALMNMTGKDTPPPAPATPAGRAVW